MMTTIKSFIERLQKIGINIELAGNYPWVYMEKINGHRIYERFRANHGFTAFFLTNNKDIDERYKITDIPKIFSKIREVLENNGELPQNHEDDFS